MPRLALISDIHANAVALEAVLADIAAQKVDAIYCLGDVVGYGPEPEHCLSRVIEVCAPGKAIMGNHDYAVLHEPIGFHRSARQAALWTRRMLEPKAWHLWGRRRQRWAWMAALPTTLTEGDVLYVHASPRHHLEEYILEEHTHGVSFTGEDPQLLLEENFALVQHLCFIGHTHRPGVVTGDDKHWHSLADLGQTWTVDERKAIINVGSVGQPRDGDPRSCYVIFDGATVAWRRVEYDIEQVRRQILANPELEDRLGDRLLTGK